MENTPLVNEAAPTKKNQLFEVTPVSKTLAVILFIILPLLGFIIGREYGLTIQAMDKADSDLSVTIPHPTTNDVDYSASNPIETIDEVLNGVIVSTTSLQFYSEPIPLDVIAQTNQGYQRFTGPEYYNSSLSVYLYKDNTIFYLPVGATTTDNPVVLISEPKSFKTFTNSLALGDGTIYYDGKVVKKSNTLTPLQYDYFSSDDTIFSPQENAPETRGLGIKTIFENVNAARLAPLSELEGKPYTYIKDKGVGIFQDSKYIYCVRTESKITLPVKIKFMPAAAEWTEFDSWENADKQVGSITFTETMTGNTYNDRCEKV